jgi:hypothetical protein
MWVMYSPPHLISNPFSVLGILVRDEAARAELRQQVGDIGLIL